MESKVALGVGAVSKDKKVYEVEEFKPDLS